MIISACSLAFRIDLIDLCAMFSDHLSMGYRNPLSRNRPSISDFSTSLLITIFLRENFSMIVVTGNKNEFLKKKAKAEKN